MGKARTNKCIQKSNIGAVIDIYSPGTQRKESSDELHRRCTLELSLEKYTSFFQVHKMGQDVLNMEGS